MNKLLICIMTVTLVASPAAFARVSSISGESTVTGLGGDVLKTVQVKCNTKKNEIRIYQRPGESTWCVSDSDQTCQDTKMRAAKQVCLTKNAPVASRDTISSGLAKREELLQLRARILELELRKQELKNRLISLSENKTP